MDSSEHTADVFDLAGFDFDRVAAPARLDLATTMPQLPDHDRVAGTVRDAAERLLDLQRQQPWGNRRRRRPGYRGLRTTLQARRFRQRLRRRASVDLRCRDA
jgi:hypothetical protein